MVPSSTQSPRCGGDISLEIPGRASARPTSSAIGSSLVLVCSAIMPFAKSSAVCSSELERMATELRQKWWIHRATSGGTRCPTSTRNRPPARYRHAPRDRTCVFARTRILHILAQRAGQSQADSRVLLGFSLFVYPTHTFVATV